MIRRIDANIQPSILTAIEPAPTEKPSEELKTQAAVISERPAAQYQDGGTAQVAEFTLMGQARQMLLQSQLSLATVNPAPINAKPAAQPSQDIGSLDLIEPETDRGLPPNPPSPGPVPITSDLSLTNKGPEVQALQQQLNQWRANQNPPKPLIPETAYFGSETDKAVHEFQTAMKLKSDGIAGPNTKDRLAMEIDPNFRKLDPDIQEQIGDKMNSYQKDPESRQNLKQLATDPNFPSLSKATQEETLNRLASNSKDPGHVASIQAVVKDIAFMEDGYPDFKNMSSDAKRQVIDRMYQYSGDEGKRHNLMIIATNSNFKALSTVQQEKLLQTFDKRPDSDMSYELRKVLNGPAWSQMDDAMKTRVLDMMDRNALDPQYTSNLASLVGDDRNRIDGLSNVDKEKVLNVFENSGSSGRKPLLDLMQKDVNGTPALLNRGSGTTGTTLDQLNKLATTALDPKNVDVMGAPITKERVMGGLMQELANPNQNIDQGNRGTCTVTSMTHTLIEKNPAEYARLVTELATTGQTKLANGETIRPPSDAWLEDNSNRSVGERLLQSSLMNYGRPGADYQNWNPGPDGFRGTLDDGFPNKVLDGFPPTGGGLGALENMRVMSALNGKTYERHTDKFTQRIENELNQGKGPVFTGVKWGGGNHAIEVYKVEGGKVFYRNPWGPGGIPGTNGTTLGTLANNTAAGPLRKAEDKNNGIESMTIENFNLYVNDIIVEKKK